MTERDRVGALAVHESGRTGPSSPRDPWPDLAARIRRPVLVVTGTADTIIARSRTRLEAIGNPWITIAVVEGAGHSVRRDRTEAFHALVDPWIRQHAGGS